MFHRQVHLVDDNCIGKHLSDGKRRPAGFSSVTHPGTELVSSTTVYRVKSESDFLSDRMWEFCGKHHATTWVIVSKTSK